MSDYDPKQLAEEILAFIAERDSIQLATRDKSNHLNISYAPYAVVGEHFYILISQLAQHCNNLLDVPELSLMLIEDEAQCKNPFARKRLTYQSVARRIDRDSELWDEGIEALTTRFGPFVKQLAALGDFIMFRLTARDGLYIKGFGRAFSLSDKSLADVLHLVGRDNREQNKNTG